MLTKDGKLVLSDGTVRPRAAVLIPFKSSDDRHSRLSWENGGMLSLYERNILAFLEVVDLSFTWSRGLGDHGDVYVGLHFGSADHDVMNKLKPITSRSLYPQVYNGTADLMSPDINEGIRNFAHRAKKNGYDALIVAGSDLPLLTTDDVEYLLSLAWSYLMKKERIVILSKARDGGTPVYLISPPTAYEIQLYREGCSNFANQIERLTQQRIPYGVIEEEDNEGLCWDLDTADDFYRIARSTRKVPNIYDETSGARALWYIKRIYHQRSMGDNSVVDVQ